MKRRLLPMRGIVSAGVLSVLGLGGALWLFAALFSYQATDPSLLCVSPAESVTNWCGAWGANCAALLRYLFGYASFLVLLVPLVAGAFWREYSWHRLMVWVDILLIGLPTTCSLVALIMISLCGASELVAAQYGGMVGLCLARLCMPRCGGFGSSMIAITILYGCARHAGLRFRSVMSGIQKSWSMLHALWRSGVHFGATCVRGIVDAAQRCEWCVVIVPTPRYHAARCAVPPAATSPDHVMHQQPNTPGAMSNASMLQTTKEMVHAVRGYRARRALIQIRGAEPAQIIWGLANTATGLKGVDALDLLGRSPYSYTVPDIMHIMHDQQLDRAARDPEQEARAHERARLLEEKLARFGIRGHTTAIRPGPVVTLFEYRPESDMRVSKLLAHEDDLALELTAMSVRTIAPIPGRNVVGFEVANVHREAVLFEDLAREAAFRSTGGMLPLLFGCDTVGDTIVEDLTQLPHLLVAGSTGSGKSVCLHNLLASLLLKRTPSELRLVLVDPKRLEFAPYQNIPHLLVPIVTHIRSVPRILAWLVHEMERRYAQLAEWGVRSLLDVYTDRQVRKNVSEQLPFIVVVIDELADLMMVVGKEVEVHIARLAQMARAAGIHLIIATQRPSVDVITGIIKVNFPARIAFRVSSKIDSKTILDTGGAERLLGRGDMLYVTARMSEPRRAHGALLGDTQIERLTDAIRSQGEPAYVDIDGADSLSLESGSSNSGEQDELYAHVLEFVQAQEEISISLLQRKYRIGFNRSARLIEKLELDGLLAPAQGSKPRKVLRR